MALLLHLYYRVGPDCSASRRWWLPDGIYSLTYPSYSGLKLAKTHSQVVSDHSSQFERYSER